MKANKIQQYIKCVCVCVCLSLYQSRLNRAIQDGLTLENTVMKPVEYCSWLVLTCEIVESSGNRKGCYSGKKKMNLDVRSEMQNGMENKW